MDDTIERTATEHGGVEPAPGPGAKPAGEFSWLDRRPVALIPSVLVLLTVMFAWWPGLITPDANQTLYQAGGLWMDWWSPFGAFATRQMFLLEFGVGALFLTQTVGLIFALYLLMRVVLRPVPASLAAALLSWIPIMWVQYSALSRDTYSLAFTVLAFAALGHASIRPERTRGQVRAWLALGFVAAVLSFLFRQNAIVVVFVIVAAAAWAATGRFPKWRRLVATAAVAGVASLVVLSATQVVYRSTGVLSVHPERPTFVYDIAAISVASNKDYFTPAIKALPAGRVTPQLADLADLKRNFRYENVASLYPPEAPIEFDFPNAKLAAREAPLLVAAWKKAVLAHPGDYVFSRLRLLCVQLGFLRRPTSSYYGLLSPNNFGHPLQFGHGYEAATDVVTKFVGPRSWIPLDIVWTHFVVVIGALVLLRRRGAAVSPLIGWMLLAGVLNLAALGLTAMAGADRYNNLVPLAAAASLLFLLAQWPRLAVVRRVD